MRFLLAWELGGGFGHLAPLRAIAREMQSRGHQCVFAVRHLEPAVAYLNGVPGTILQAPVSIRANDPPPFEHLSYASILFGCGFHRASALTARTLAWRHLIELCDCQAVIAHHSPTALLAAHSLSIPSALIGSGFMVPPPATPLPGFRASNAVMDARVAAVDAAVLRTTNESLEQIGATPLDSLGQLIARSFSGLFTYAELDHYPGGHPQPYRGLPTFAEGARATWGPHREPRLFAYLRPFPGLHSLMQALHQLPIQVLARIAEADLSALAPLQRNGLVIVDRDVDLRAVAADCDAYINYGAHGTLAEMLLAGKPGLLLPTTLERNLVTRRVVAMGAALAAPGAEGTNYETPIRRLFDDDSLRTAAGMFASRYSAQAREEILPRWCEELLAHIVANPT